MTLVFNVSRALTAGKARRGTKILWITRPAGENFGLSVFLCFLPFLQTPLNISRANSRALHWREGKTILILGENNAANFFPLLEQQAGFFLPTPFFRSSKQETATFASSSFYMRHAGHRKVSVVVLLLVGGGDDFKIAEFASGWDTLLNPAYPTPKRICTAEDSLPSPSQFSSGWDTLLDLVYPTPKRIRTAEDSLTLPSQFSSGWDTLLDLVYPTPKRIIEAYFGFTNSLRGGIPSQCVSHPKGQLSLPPFFH